MPAQSSKKATAWIARKRRLKTHWAALAAELDVARRRAESFRADKKEAPLYRMPRLAFQTSYPVLLAEGVVNHDEVITIGECYDLLGDINRGLENAAKAAHARDDTMVAAEANRLGIKTTRLLDGDEKGGPRLTEALEVIEARRSQHWWSYTGLW